MVGTQISTMSCKLRSIHTNPIPRKCLESTHALPRTIHPTEPHLHALVREELLRDDDEEQHLHDVLVALENLGGEPDLGLDFEAVEPGRARKLQEHDGEWDEGQDEDVQENAVAVEEVMGLGGEVLEPKGARAV